MTKDQEQIYYSETVNYIESLIQDNNLINLQDDSISDIDAIKIKAGSQALSKLRSSTKSFGDIIMNITLIPDNSSELGYKKWLKTDSKVLNYIYQITKSIINEPPGNHIDRSEMLACIRGKKRCLNKVLVFIKERI